MNHHFRSYSEQPQLAPAPAAAASGNNTGGAGPQSIIRIHSDSQQSLDQLFNQTLSSKPLRERNLPPSFFNPSLNTEGETNGTHEANGNHHQNVASPMHGVNNFHSRSISLAGPVATNGRPTAILRQNFHTRTHSTLAPMPRLDSNHSSHQSSHEFLNTASNNNNNNNNNNSTNNVSSCQQHGGENIVSSTSTNNHNHHHHHHLHSNASNGWSSQGNSIDDLNTAPQGWVGKGAGGGGAGGGQPQSTPHQQQPIVQPAPMQIVHQHHHSIMQAEQAIPTAAIRQHQPHHQQHEHYQAQHQPVFYNQSQPQQVADTTTVGAPTTNHLCPTHSLHSRSMSVQQPMHGGGARANHNLHMRTHSTAEPCNHHLQVASHHSSHQSSREFLNNSSATNASAGTTGWSTSSGCSTDDMSAASSGGWPASHHPHNHNHSHNHQHQHQHAHVQQQSVPQQTTHLHITQQPLPQPPTMGHQPAPVVPCPTATMQHGHNGHHHHHHHHHIPMQVPHSPQQVPQQLFYNV